MPNNSFAKRREVTVILSRRGCTTMFYWVCPHSCCEYHNTTLSFASDAWKDEEKKTRCTHCYGAVLLKWSMHPSTVAEGVRMIGHQSFWYRWTCPTCKRRAGGIAFPDGHEIECDCESCGSTVNVKL